MRQLFVALAALLIFTACDVIAPKEVKVTDAYSFETPARLPAAAIFLTIENNTDSDDRMIAFRTPLASRSELHTMEMNGDIMRMRRINAYDVAVGGTHVLEPGGDHIMIFGVEEDLVAGESFDGVAVMERAGEIPVTINVRERQAE